MSEEIPKSAQDMTADEIAVFRKNNICYQATFITRGHRSDIEDTHPSHVQRKLDQLVKNCPYRSWITKIIESRYNPECL